MYRLVLACVLACTAAAHAGERQADTLTTAIAASDRTLFDAYNACDLPKLGSMVAEDLEFYHDQAGLMRGRASFVDAIRASVCGKVRRELVLGSLEVYPLKGYGAVEIGHHTFCPTDGAGLCKTPGAPAKFVHVWRETGESWILARVISYDHH